MRIDEKGEKMSSSNRISAKELKQLILEDKENTNDIISLKRLKRKILGNEQVK